MTKVILHGELATEMGRAEWMVLIQQPREALAAIEANTGKLYEYLRRKHLDTEGQAEYRVIVDGREIGRPGEGEIPADFYLVGVYLRIEIVPVLAGAGGIFQAIIGVVLIIVGVILIATGIGAAIAPYVILAGISLTLGGISQMLTPTPKLGGGIAARSFANTDELGQKKEGPAAAPSYLFSGAVNTTQQGNPVPVAYGGPMLVGSALVSLAISGSSIGTELIGAQRSPLPADTFYDLPVWARLLVDPRRDAISNQGRVRNLSTSEVVQLRSTYGLPATFPSTFGDTRIGNPVPVGNSNLPPFTLRGWLSTLSYFFHGNPQPVKFREALSLYRALGIDTLDQPQLNTFKAIVLAIALFLSPDP